MRIPLFISLPDDEIQQEITLSKPHLYPGQRYVVKTPEGRSLLYKATSNRDLVKIDSKARYSVQPADVRQRLSLDALNDPNITMCIILGPSGTGKSCLSIAEGIRQVSKGDYEALIVIKALTTVGNSKGWGTLPGVSSEKVSPYVESVYDVAESIGQTDRLLRLEEEGRLEFIPVDILRGRDLRKSFIILEECLTKDHLIYMNDGSVKAIQDIKIGDEVISTDPETLVMKKGRVDGCISRFSNELMEIKTQVTDLICTKDHPFYIYKNGFVKKKARELTFDDFIPMPKKLPHTEKNYLDPKIAYFIGMILSDGHIEKDFRSIKMSVSKDREHCEKNFRNGMISLIGKDLSRDFINARGDYNIGCGRQWFAKKISEEYGIPAGKKSNLIRVPESLFTSNIDAVKSFIQSLYDCEGDINITNSGSLVVNYTTCSPMMAKEVSLLLRKFGIIARKLITYKQKENHNNLHRLYLSGVNAYKFYKEIGFSLQRKQEVLSSFYKDHIPQDNSRIPIIGLLNERLKTIGKNKYKSKSPCMYLHNLESAYSEYFSKDEMIFFREHEFVQIKSLSLCTEGEEVFDFRVPETGTFYVDGLLSSNCQNLYPNELLTASTRVGEGSKIVLNGDPNQCDLMGGEPGLYKLLDYQGLWESPIVYYMNLTKRMRSPICEIVEDAIVGDSSLSPMAVVEDTTMNLD